MPIHDWTIAPSGYFHHFHQIWTAGLCDSLNAGRLPPGMFALVEQHSGALVPDVLALEMGGPSGWDGLAGRGGTAVITDPPKTRFVSRSSEDRVYAAKANRIVIQRPDETVAVIEIVSPGNKSSVAALEEFVEKSHQLLERGVNLLVVDLFPPTARDPDGIHKVIWDAFNGEKFALPSDKPLVLASYTGGLAKAAYIEAVAVGDQLPEMPIFLTSSAYVRVPLEETYNGTWTRCPEVFKQRVLSGWKNPS